MILPLINKLNIPFFTLCSLVLGCTLLSACRSAPQVVSAKAVAELLKDEQYVQSYFPRKSVSNPYPPNLSSQQSSEHTTDTHSALYAKRPIHWEYEGSHGPEHWAELSPDFSTCGTGKLQSPFDIRSDMKAALPNLTFAYQAVALVVKNNGHTIVVDQEGAGHLGVNGKTYALKQFHFHSPSEHTINGKSFPLEMHFVHASQTGELAVVGVMFETGVHNTELAKIWGNMPALKGVTKAETYRINAKNLLPNNKTYSRFMGSLTTPPCSEGVNWHMMQTPLTASADQIEQFKAIYPNNARPLQDENNRLVVQGIYE